MKIQLYVVLMLAAGAARADFSYSMTQTGGPGASQQPTKYYYKGQKMKIDGPNNQVIMDFDAQTVTTFHPSDHTYTVKKLPTWRRNPPAPTSIRWM